MGTKWREEHPERVLELRRRYRERNREKINTRQREKRKADPAKHRAASLRWQRENPDKVRAAQREHARRRRVGRDAEAHDFAEVVRADLCSYCGGEGGTLDHIEPVTNGGLNCWDNFAGACHRCNSAKRSTPLLAFLLRG